MLQEEVSSPNAKWSLSLWGWKTHDRCRWGAVITSIDHLVGGFNIFQTFSKMFSKPFVGWWWWSHVWYVCFQGFEGGSGQPVTSLLERLRRRMLVPSAVTVAPGTTDIKPCKWYIRYTRYTYKLDSGSKRFRRGGRAGGQRLASLESFWPRTVSESGRERTAVACVPVKPASTYFWN